MTHLAEVAFLWGWDTFIVTVRRRQRRWVVISTTGVSRRWHLRKWWGPTWRLPPIQAVALTVQSVPAACPLLLTHLLLLHGFLQEAVIVIISPAPGAAATIPVIPLHIHQIIPATAASPLEASGGPSVSSPPIFWGIVAPPAVVIVAIVATAGATAPAIIRAEETESRKIQHREFKPHNTCTKLSFANDATNTNYAFLNIFTPEGVFCSKVFSEKNKKKNVLRPKQALI